MLEEKNRDLTGLLELVYWELAVAREKSAAVGSGLVHVQYKILIFLYFEGPNFSNASSWGPRS